MLRFIEILFFLVVVLPVSAYLTVKFGWVGYFRAKRRDNENKQEKTHEQN